MQQYCWIIDGRSAVKRVIRQCLYCRIKRAKQLYPFMADLPKGRMAFDEPPFTNCGVDLFGPLSNKVEKVETMGRIIYLSHSPMCSFRGR